MVHLPADYVKELEGCILLISLKYILEDIELGKIVYILYLKEY
jgi:hypothetical protein